MANSRIEWTRFRRQSDLTSDSTNQGQIKASVKRDPLQSLCATAPLSGCAPAPTRDRRGGGYDGNRPG